MVTGARFLVWMSWKGLLDESTKHWGPVLSQIKAADVPSFSHQFSCAIASYPMLSLNISRRLAWCFVATAGIQSSLTPSKLRRRCWLGCPPSSSERRRQGERARRRGRCPWARLSSSPTVMCSTSTGAWRGRLRVAFLRGALSLSGQARSPLDVLGAWPRCSVVFTSALLPLVW